MNIIISLIWCLFTVSCLHIIFLSYWNVKKMCLMKKTRKLTCNNCSFWIFVCDSKITIIDTIALGWVSIFVHFDTMNYFIKFKVGDKILILWCHYQGKRLGLRLRQLKPTRCYPMIWNICNSCFAITKHIIQKISGLCSESYLFSTNCKLSINYQYNYKKICCFHNMYL